MPTPNRPRRVLFVCLGNICRSPTGEAVLRAEVEKRGLGGEIEVDSAGTIDEHRGEPADARMRQAAGRRGYDLSSRARRVTAGDFREFDLIVAMDRQNLADLRDLAPPAADRRADLRLFSEFLPAGSPADVPDPYWGGVQGFEQVLDLVEDGAARIVDHLAGTPESG